MGKWLLASAASAAVVGLVAGGTLDRGRLYHLPISDVRSRLAALPAPDASMMASGIGAAGVERTAHEREIRWRVRGGDGASVLYVAELVPFGERETRVRLRVQHEGANVSEKLTSTRFLRGFGTASFAEAIDAALEENPKRRLDPVRDWAFEASNDPDQVREVGQAISSMYAETAKSVHGQTSGAERSTAARMEAATRPMINPVPIERQQEWNR
ncbi:hypothetical protein [Sphingomonas humi]|uniref:Uncharacterized protein n=1 Tax=Sphingomonas humi TaxID=335630 RepID=A0ABP7RL67_9SPHN